MSVRAINHTSIYACELTAIRTAIEVLARRKQNGLNDSKAAIFTDSISVITSFQTGKSTARPNLFSETL